MKFTDEHDAYKASIEDAMIAKAEMVFAVPRCCKCDKIAQWQDACRGQPIEGGPKWCYEHALQWRDFGGVVPIGNWEEAVNI